MRVIYRKIRHASYLYIKRNVKKVWGARYLSKNTVIANVLKVYYHTSYKEPILNGASVVSTTQVQLVQKFQGDRLRTH